ncbi:YagK/YfjJ domain-containing protein [Fluviibacter phosphoraccumulans]|uniref:YagK/YfjJ domain-containing protein n=1 Tax=Fluviibacter phosphoraccumulans TaxID=1751046 RepID=UPI0024E20E2D|nr:inovirus-type Gp2 protein [Fluviibacter phosphoraccumulans]
MMTDRKHYTLPDHKIASLKEFFRDYAPQITKTHHYGDGFDRLIEIEQFVAMCIKEEAPGFLPMPNKPVHLSYAPTPLASLFYEKVNEWMRLYRPHLHYSPLIDLFFQSCIDLRIAHEPLQAPYSTHSGGTAHAVRFNELIERIRSVGLSKPYRDRTNEARSRAMDQFIRWVTNVDYLFDHVRSRMIVIRLDLFYRRDVAVLIEPEEADSDFKRFLANMKGKPTLFGDMLYYVWKAEQSRSGAYHYHFLLFFTNDRLLRDDYRSKQIGEYWQNEITQGRGTYFNANLSTEKAKYKKLAIGRIEWSDHDKRENMKNIFAYFCKDDQSLRVKVSKKTRSFGSSSMPLIDKQRGGRPRVNLTFDETATV